MSTAKSKRLLFIVGAGASVSYGLPSGQKLVEQIGALLSPAARSPSESWNLGRNSQLFRALIELDQEYKNAGKIEQHHQAHFEAAVKIWRGLPAERSIDRYVQSHATDEPLTNVAKLSIANCILAGERAAKVLIPTSNTYVDGGIASIDLWAIREAEDSWYPHLWQTIKGTATLSELRERFRSISFIIFNYDRCIEHFIYSALRSYYGIRYLSEVKEVFDELEIYHPYGQVGPLPWQVPEGTPAVEFGADLSYRGLIDVSKSIRTYSEGTNPTASDINRIRECCQIHRQMVCLGFGFLRENVDLLMPKAQGNLPGKAIELFATAFEKSDEDIRRLESDLRKRLSFDRVEFHLDPLKCNALFEKHSHGLDV